MVSKMLAEGGQVGRSSGFDWFAAQVQDELLYQPFDLVPHLRVDLVRFADGIRNVPIENGTRIPRGRS